MTHAEWQAIPRPERHLHTDTSELDAMFAPYHTSGERVEIEWTVPGDYSGYGARTEGRMARGYIGKSTGWKPCYLLIQTRRSYGGFSIRASDVKSIRGLGIYR